MFLEVNSVKRTGEKVRALFNLNDIMAVNEHLGTYYHRMSKHPPKTGVAAYTPPYTKKGITYKKV